MLYQVKKFSEGLLIYLCGVLFVCLFSYLFLNFGFCLPSQRCFLARCCWCICSISPQEDSWEPMGTRGPRMMAASASSKLPATRTRAQARRRRRRRARAGGRQRAGPGPHSGATVGGGLAPRSQRAPGFLLPAWLHPCTPRSAGSGAKVWGGAGLRDFGDAHRPREAGAERRQPGRSARVPAARRVSWKPWDSGSL